MKIIVQGLAGEGKSTIAQLVVDACAEHGINVTKVELADELPDDFFEAENQLQRLKSLCKAGITVAIVVEHVRPT
jgi:adenylylsulfate kinase-like enzyme